MTILDESYPRTDQGDTPSEWQTSFSNTRTFAESGDSGSLVFQTVPTDGESAVLVGMVIGGSALTKLSYCTPKSLILKSIEATVGEEFRLCGFNERIGLKGKAS